MSTQIVVAVSGSGRTLLNLVEHQKRYKNYNVCGVITSSESCLAIKHAIKLGLPYLIDTFTQSTQASDKLTQWLKKLGAEWVLLAGFLKKFPTSFTGYSNIEKRIINIHPSLLPSFGGKGMYGKKVHQAVLQGKKQSTGATIHFVNNEYDKGDIISQIKVPVFQEDSIDTLSDRVFDAECQLYPQTISLLIEKIIPLKKNTIYDYNKINL